MEKMEYAKKVAELTGGIVEEPVEGMIAVRAENVQIFTDGLCAKGLTPEMVAVMVQRCKEEARRRKEEAEAFMQGLTPESWEEAKGILCANLGNESEAEKISADGLYMNASEFGFDDLIIVPCLNLNGDDVRCVKESDLGRWGIDRKTLFETMIENVNEPTFESMGQIAARATGIEYDPLMDVTMPAMVIANYDQLKSLGAIGIIKAKEKLAGLYPDGYTLIPSSKWEMMAFPGHLDEEFARSLIQQENEKLPWQMILGTKPYYFEGRRAR